MLLATLLVVGFLVAGFFAATGRSLNLFPLEAAVTGLGLVVVVLALVDAALIRQLNDRFKRDHAAESSPFRGLAIVLLIGAAIAIGFVLTDNQLGIFPLEPAVTALGVAVTVLTIVTIWLVLILKEMGIQLSLSEQPLVVVPANEEDQHVLLIEGIGEKYAARLNAWGIITIPQLLAAEPGRIAKCAQCTQELAREWQSMGLLMQVKGIGAQYAEILVMAGIKTVAELAQSDPERLLARIDAIEESRKVRVLKTDLKAGHVRKFIQGAKEHLEGDIVRMRAKQAETARV